MSLALGAAACGGDSEDAATTTAVAPSATTAPAGDSTVDSIEQPEESATTAVAAATTAAAPATTEAAEPEPDSDRQTSSFVSPGDADYLDVLGSTAIQAELTLEPGGISVLTTFDESTGRGHEVSAGPTGPDETWLSDGVFDSELLGELVPRLTPPGVFSSLRSEGFFPNIDVTVFDGVDAAGTVDEDGATLTEYIVEGDDAIDHLVERNATSPTEVEYQAARFRVLVDDAGALVRYETNVTSRQEQFGPDFIDGSTVFTVAPVGGSVPEPTIARVGNYNDQLATNYLRRAGSHYISLVREADSADIGFDEYVDGWDDTRLSEVYGLDVGEIGDASTSTVGYGDGTMVVQSAGGAWFCLAYATPLGANSTLQGSVERTGNSPEAAAGECAADLGQ